MKPRYKNNCPHCIFLGCILHEDAYFCPTTHDHFPHLTQYHGARLVLRSRPNDQRGGFIAYFAEPPHPYYSNKRKDTEYKQMTRWCCQKKLLDKVTADRICQ